METFLDIVVARFNYWIYVILMMIGLYAMITKNNLIKKLIGMSIFQTAIILFFVSISAKQGATIPILLHAEHSEHAEHGENTGRVAAHSIDSGPGTGQESGFASALPDGGDIGIAEHEPAHGGGAIDPDHYDNPLPHVLMLTAIVVGVATLGVGLAVAQKIHRDHGTLEEDELLERIRATDG